MPKIRTRADRAREQREVDAAIARALLEAEPSERSKATSVSIHVFDDDRPPRYPAVGLHPGAIDGTVPHRCRLVRG